MQDHDQGLSHPERPERLATILAALERQPVAGTVFARPAPCALEPLELVHEPEYLRLLASHDGHHTQLDDDTSMSPGSLMAARLAAGAVIDAVDAIMTGRAARAFALVRPPGHHAEADRAMGFCLLNNIAIGAAHALQVHRLQRVLIVDWDVHHGNGTQHIFEDSDQVLVFNTHQSPLYPGTGAREEVGRGAGRGCTVNVPLPAGTTDSDMAAVYAELLTPIAEQFAPELILVSAGYDAHRDDPLGSMRLTTAGFGALCSTVDELARQHCGGRLILTLEGGYHLQALAASVRASIAALAGEPPPPLETRTTHAARQALDMARAVQREFWSV